jgi:predicted helicase
MFLNDLKKNKEYTFDENKITKSIYRPFQKMNFCYEKSFLQRTFQQLAIFPTDKHKNILICLSCAGTNKDLSVLITDTIADLHFVGDTQCFPLYYYEKRTGQIKLEDIINGDDKYIRHDGISDFILNEARRKYLPKSLQKSAATLTTPSASVHPSKLEGNLKPSASVHPSKLEGNLNPSAPCPPLQIGGELTKEDIFYYVYGFLHSPEYRKAFANDLKKMLPRIPLVDDVKDFWAFSKAGRELAELHLNYENVPKHKDVREVTTPSSKLATPPKLDGNYKVSKKISHHNYVVNNMKFAKFPSNFGGVDACGRGGLKYDKTKIIYNNHITLENIPLVAYEYIVNGKSAIEWIMDRYCISEDKKSGIVNDANDWCEESGNPRYIIDLLHSIINLSVKTVEIVNKLPKMEFENTN